METDSIARASAAIEGSERQGLAAKPVAMLQSMIADLESDN